jgi:flotillin
MDRRVEQLLAEGEASSIAAKGEAVSQALAHLHGAWVESGEHAMDMVVVQHLDEIFTRVTAAATQAHANEVSLLDGGDGRTVASYVASYPATVRALLDQLSTTFGVSFNSILRGDEANAPMERREREDSGIAELGPADSEPTSIEPAVA